MASIEQILTSDRADTYRMSLDIPIPGYRDFTTPWLIRENGFGVVMGTGFYRDILIDPGPSCGVPSLLECLGDLGVRKIDYVLLTHVHIDHAGGVAELAAAYPGLKVVVHEKGRTHLLQPSRLWEGSLQTLGDVARAFGPILPLPERNLMPAGSEAEGVRVIDTPGHAAHHQSYVFRCGEKDVLFSGEAAGAYMGGDYLRPATPPRFFYDVSLASLEKLRGAGASVICTGHFGYSSDAPWLLSEGAKQLALWRGIIADGAQDIDSCLGRLLAADPHLRGVNDLDQQTKEREIFYLKSSIKGFLG